MSNHGGAARALFRSLFVAALASSAALAVACGGSDETWQERHRADPDAGESNGDGAASTQDGGRSDGATASSSSGGSGSSAGGSNGSGSASGSVGSGSSSSGSAGSGSGAGSGGASGSGGACAPGAACGGLRSCSDSCFGTGCCYLACTCTDATGTSGELTCTMHC